MFTVAKFTVAMHENFFKKIQHLEEQTCAYGASRATLLQKTMAGNVLFNYISMILTTNSYSSVEFLHILYDHVSTS